MNHRNNPLSVPLSALILLLGVAGACAQEHEGHQGHNESAVQQSDQEHDGAHRQVRLNQDQLARLDVRVAKARAGAARSVVKAPANVQFDADREAKVGPRITAKVVRVTKDLGDRVAIGDTLAVLDSVALGKAKASYLQAAARLQSTSAAYEREKQLAAEQIASEAELLEARANFREAKAARDAARAELRLYGMSQAEIDDIEAGGEQPLSRFGLASPAAGVVQQRDLTPGETLRPEDTPIHVVDTQRMWVMIEAFERDLDLLSVGQEMRFTARALGDRGFSGRVDWISRDLDAKTRTVRVRAVADNPDGLLRAGMFGQARINTETAVETALISLDSVQTVHGERSVFVPADDEGTFRARPVRLGASLEGQVEVTAGLKPGERFVSQGAFDLKSALTAGTRSAAHSH